MDTICIYHGNCADGFGAAWVVRKALGNGIVFYPGVYQNDPPWKDIEGRSVLMVDFSYRRQILEQIRERATSVVILDHHKTAEVDLKDLPGVESVFDMNRSGARITWDYFFPNVKPPELLLHIEDRDLWRFVLPGTRQIQAGVFSYPYTFDLYDEWMAGDEIAQRNALKDLEADGKAIERKHFKDIEELTKVVTRDFTIGGYTVPVANLPYTLTSDAGLLLAKGKPFAGCYWDTPEGRVFSLRSADDGLDVSAIAKQYGGGGHRNASGFRVPYGHELTK